MTLAAPKNDLVEKYYRTFQSTDSTGSSGVWTSLREQVPVAEREEFFACLLDRGAKDPDNGAVAGFILPAVSNEHDRWTWSAHLERAVLAQAKHKDSGVRAVLADSLARYDRVKHRDLILSFLNDPEPRVQYAVVASVYYWPDVKSILNGYVASHTADPTNYRDPVTHAKQILAGDF